jgi:4-diphosphocytidyl-2-C-methyl-D-erythritol kinase
MRLAAPAKLNLSLTVLGRRDDGYHLLDSRVVLLELADGLLLLPGCSGLRVEGEAGSALPVDDRNLAWRGLVAGLGTEPDLCCLALEKRIPLAAGMGGGSSDAAAARRLGRVWRGLPEGAADEADMEGLAAIGADVPFFAACVAAARVTGIGEHVEPEAAERAHVVLAHPPFGLSTAGVFGELRPDEWGTAENDLLAPAIRLRPELDDLFGLVAKAGGTPRLTGSGPTVFTLTPDHELAVAVVGRLRDAGVRVTQTRTRDAAASIERIIEED